VTAALAPMLGELEYTCPTCRGSTADQAREEALATRALLPLEAPPPPLPLCMLTPVYGPDFLALAARLTLQRNYESGTWGAPPTTVIIFDDRSAANDFCSQYASLCTADLVPLALDEILGSEQYAWVRAAGSKPGRVARAEIGLSSNHGCKARTYGQSYQALKKFLGALHGPRHCHDYFVADAESFPFRRYDWQRIATGRAVGHHLTSHWHAGSRLAAMKPTDRVQCSKAVHSDWTDPACETMIAHQLNLEPPLLRTKLFWQQSDVADQFWFYRRALVAAMVEEVETTMRMPFARAWMGWRFSDASFHNLWVLKDAVNATEAGRPPLQKVRNLPAEIARVLPLAHHECCTCSHTRKLPCRQISDLMTPCMLRVAGAPSIASFLTEHLGMFGSWFEKNRMPASVLDASRDDGISWCINNCFNKRFYKLLMKTAVNLTFAAVCAESQVVQRAFKEDKIHG